MLYEENVQDTKGVIRSLKSKKEWQKIQWPKGQTMIYKTLHRKLIIGQEKF